MSAEHDGTDVAMIGWEVRTRDGEHVGRVKEVRAGWLKVDARLHPDYWLSPQTIAGRGDGRVTLSVNKDELDHHKVGEPASQDTAGWDRGSMVGPITHSLPVPGPTAAYAPDRHQPPRDEQIDRHADTNPQASPPTGRTPT